MQQTKQAKEELIWAAIEPGRLKLDGFNGEQK